MLEEFIGNAWGYHDAETDRLVTELEAIDIGEISQATAANFLKLANHTIGEHFGDWGKARRLAERVFESQSVPDDPLSWLHLSNARYCEGDLPNALSAELKFLGMSEDLSSAYIELKLSFVGSLFGSGKLEEASQLYMRILEIVELYEGERSYDRILAITSNNICGQLLEINDRTESMDRLMEVTSKTALKYWRKCGNWMTEQRAFYLRLLVANELEEFEQALDNAGQALSIIQKNGEEPVDEAFIRMASAKAHLGLNQPSDYERELSLADALAQAWDEESLKSWYQTERQKTIGS